MGKNIQNEIIQILRNVIKKKIISAWKTAKYYSIFYCIEDISKQEEMTMIPAEDVCEVREDSPAIKECFVGFLDLIDLLMLE